MCMALNSVIVSRQAFLDHVLRMQAQGVRRCRRCKKLHPTDAALTCAYGFGVCRCLEPAYTEPGEDPRTPMPECEVHGFEGECLD